MKDRITRRDLIKGLGAVGAGSMLKSIHGAELIDERVSPEINRPLPQAVLTRFRLSKSSMIRSRITVR